MSPFQRPPNGHGESRMDEDSSNGARELIARTRELKNLLDDSDFDDDTRASVQVYVGTEPTTPETPTVPPVMKRWKPYILGAFMVGAFVAGLLMTLFK